jgi:hypothetical protein
MKLKNNFYPFLLLLMFGSVMLSACKKQEIEFIPKTTTLRTLSYTGYNASDSVVIIGLSEKLINFDRCNSYESVATGLNQVLGIPFTSDQNSFDVLLKTANGQILNSISFPKTGNLRVNFLKLADTVLINPVFPTPPIGSMAVKLEFHSTLNKSYNADLDLVIYNTAKNGQASTQLTKVPAVRRGKLSSFILPPPAKTAGNYYAFQLVKAGTSSVFPTTAATGTATTTYTKGLITFAANSTKVLTVTDNETITGTKTKRYTYTYQVDDLGFLTN